MALGLTITTQGRDDLALAISQSDSLTITNIILTDSQTTGTLSDIQTVSDLGGSTVATMTASGHRIDTGKVQVEGNDNTTAQYEAKTMALTYSKNSQTRVFALYTSASPFIYKVSDTTVLVVAAIAIDDTQAQSITFSNVTLSFPPATTSANGSVELSTESELKNPPAVDASHPIVPSAQTVNAVLKDRLGNSLFSDGIVDVPKQITAGKTKKTDYVISKGSFIDYGQWMADWPYDDFDFRDFYNAECKQGSTVLGTCYLVNNANAFIVDSMSNIIGGVDASVPGQVTISLYNEPTDDITFTLYTKSESSLRNLKAEDASFDLVSSKSLNIGGLKSIEIDSSDYYYSGSRTKYYYKGVINAFNIRGITSTYPVLYYNSTTYPANTYEANKFYWIINGRTYRLYADPNSYTNISFQCEGGVPEDVTLEFVERGNAVLKGDATVNGLNLSQSGLLGWAKLRVSKSNASSSTTAEIVDSFNITVTYPSNDRVRVEYTGPSIRNPMFAEGICGENFFGTSNKVKTVLKEFASDSTVIFFYSYLSDAPLTNIPLLIKVY